MLRWSLSLGVHKVKLSFTNIPCMSENVIISICFSNYSRRRLRNIDFPPPIQEKEEPPPPVTPPPLSSYQQTSDTSSSFSTFEEVESLNLSSSSSSLSRSVSGPSRNASLSLSLHEQLNTSRESSSFEMRRVPSNTWQQPLRQMSMDRMSATASSGSGTATTFDEVESLDLEGSRNLDFESSWPAKHFQNRDVSFSRAEAEKAAVREDCSSRASSRSDTESEGRGPGRVLIMPEEDEELPFAVYTFNKKKEDDSTGNGAASSAAAAPGTTPSLLDKLQVYQHQQSISSVESVASHSHTSLDIGSEEEAAHFPPGLIQRLNGNPGPAEHIVQRFSGMARKRNVNFSQPSTDSLSSSVSSSFSESMPMYPYPMPMSNAEDVLMNLGFSGASSFLPERFARDWMAKALKGKPSAGSVAPATPVTKTPDVNRPMPNQTTSVARQERIPRPRRNIADFLHKLDINSRNTANLRRAKFRRAATMMQANEDDESVTTTDHSYTQSAGNPQHGRPLLRQDSLEQLKGLLERQAELFDKASSDGSKLAQSRKAFGQNRQNSLPLFLETLSEEEEARNKKNDDKTSSQTQRSRILTPLSEQGSAEENADSGHVLPSQSLPSDPPSQSESSSTSDKSLTMLKPLKVGYLSRSSSQGSDISYLSSSERDMSPAGSRKPSFGSSQYLYQSSHTSNDCSDLDSDMESIDGGGIRGRSKYGKALPIDMPPRGDFLAREQDHSPVTTAIRSPCVPLPAGPPQLPSFAVPTIVVNNKLMSQSSQSIEIAEIMNKSFDNSEYGSDMSDGEGSRKVSVSSENAASPKVEPALLTLTLKDVEHTTARRRRSSTDEDGRSLLPPMSLVSPSPTSPITVIEAESLDNTEDGVESLAEKEEGQKTDASRPRRLSATDEPLTRSPSSVHSLSEKNSQKTTSPNIFFTGITQDRATEADAALLSPLMLFSASEESPTGCSSPEEYGRRESSSLVSSPLQGQCVAVQADDGTLTPVMFGVDPDVVFRYDNQVFDTDVCIVADIATQYECTATSLSDPLAADSVQTSGTQTETPLAPTDSSTQTHSELEPSLSWLSLSRSTSELEPMSYYTNEGSQTDGSLWMRSVSTVSGSSSDANPTPSVHPQLDKCPMCRTYKRMQAAGSLPTGGNIPSHSNDVVAALRSNSKELLTSHGDSAPETGTKYSNVAGRKTLDQTIARLLQKINGTKQSELTTMESLDTDSSKHHLLDMQTSTNSPALIPTVSEDIQVAEMSEQSPAKKEEVDCMVVVSCREASESDSSVEETTCNSDANSKPPMMLALPKLQSSCTDSVESCGSSGAESRSTASTVRRLASPVTPTSTQIRPGQIDSPSSPSVVSGRFDATRKPLTQMSLPTATTCLHQSQDGAAAGSHSHRNPLTRSTTIAEGNPRKWGIQRQAVVEHADWQPIGDTDDGTDHAILNVDSIGEKNMLIKRNQFVTMQASSQPLKKAVNDDKPRKSKRLVTLAKMGHTSLVLPTRDSLELIDQRTLSRANTLGDSNTPDTHHPPPLHAKDVTPVSEEKSEYWDFLRGPMSDVSVPILEGNSNDSLSANPRSLSGTGGGELSPEKDMLPNPITTAMTLNKPASPIPKKPEIFGSLSPLTLRKSPESPRVLNRSENSAFEERPNANNYAKTEADQSGLALSVQIAEESSVKLERSNTSVNRDSIRTAVGSSHLLLPESQPTVSSGSHAVSPKINRDTSVLSPSYYNQRVTQVTDRSQGTLLVQERASQSSSEGSFRTRAKREEIASAIMKDVFRDLNGKLKGNETLDDSSVAELDYTILRAVNRTLDMLFSSQDSSVNI